MNVFSKILVVVKQCGITITTPITPIYFFCMVIITIFWVLKGFIGDKLIEN